MRCLLIFLALTATSAAALPSEELHRLAAYCAYAVAAVKADGGGGTPDKPVTPSGGACVECDGLKKIGDGTIMFTCPHCNGTGREPGASSAPEGDPQMLQPDAVAPEPEPQEEEPEEESSPSLTSMKQTEWNWNGAGSPPLSVKRKHLISEHKVDQRSVNKMSDAEIEALHNLLHNSEVRSAPPKAKSKSSSSCPGGNCPTSNSATTYRRYSVFRRR